MMFRHESYPSIPCSWLPGHTSPVSSVVPKVSPKTLASCTRVVVGSTPTGLEAFYRLQAPMVGQSSALFSLGETCRDRSMVDGLETGLGPVRSDSAWKPCPSVIGVGTPPSYRCFQTCQSRPYLQEEQGGQVGLASCAHVSLRPQAAAFSVLSAQAAQYFRSDGLMTP